ncbi:MAG: molybdopterin dinucleotide binding domain-containing protein, partial [Solirubrobacteraceae bacterium]
LAAHLEDAERCRALVCWNVNPAASCPEQARLRRALAREDLFTGVCDLFATDTADLADVVLPAASWLECNDIVIPYFHRALSAQVKAAEPLGEALPNSEIFRRMATAMGLDDAPLHEPDDEILARVMASSGTGLDFAGLAQRGTVWPSAQPVVAFEDRRFPTPSGRVELASDAAQADGHGRLPRPHADPRPERGRLRLLSPASPWALNASFSNDPKIARRTGALELALTEADATERGLAAGDLVRVTSPAGELVVPVRITDELPAGVALLPKGRWPKLEPAGANVNALTLAQPSDMGQSTTVHGLEVSVAAVRERAPA